MARLDYVQLKSRTGKNLTQTARACPSRSEGLDVSTKQTTGVQDISGHQSFAKPNTARCEHRSESCILGSGTTHRND